jgi:hypothetical protein
MTLKQYSDVWQRDDRRLGRTIKTQPQLLRQEIDAAVEKRRLNRRERRALEKLTKPRKSA